MRKSHLHCLALFLLFLSGLSAGAQEPWTWERVRTRFEQNNPSLRAGKLSIDESKAQEITAYLRPNPNLTLIGDQIDPFGGGPPHGPFAFFLPIASVNYLHERDHKRESRLESAQQATGIVTSTQADLERNLLFNLRGSQLAHGEDPVVDAAQRPHSGRPV
jgi:outer membrane protein, heavy metal efflux system